MNVLDFVRMGCIVTSQLEDNKPNQWNNEISSVQEIQEKPLNPMQITKPVRLSCFVSGLPILLK